jgi:hypothetical protein
MPAETPAYDPLHNQVIGRTGSSHSNSEVDLPLRRKVQIGCEEELLLLIAKRVKSAGISMHPLVLNTGIDPLCEVKAHFDIGRKGDAIPYSGTVTGMIEGRIER